jgi:crotonobetainyl-CoA:carnitine CoA-transferase CaiB-like acyl-CoA transferase
MFGSLGILGALHQRNETGKGQLVIASLYESTVFLVGQHMAQKAVTGNAAAPMPARVSAWAIYQVFDTKDDDQVFVGVVSDKQWVMLCESFGLDELGADETLKTNSDRVANKERLVPLIKEAFAAYTKAELMEKLEATGLPFAPITRPEDLFEDPHLNSGGGLVPFTVTDGEFKGQEAKLPALPLEMDGNRFGLYQPVPRAGEHTRDVLAEAGYSDAEIDQMIADGVVTAE